MLALILEGLATCGDRVLIIFNEIEILGQFHQPDLSRAAFRDLAIRAERYERLKKYAQNECRRLRLGDTIETILFFHLYLKDALHLPITTQGMLYPDCSGVTPQMLDEAANAMRRISNEELLASSSYWQEYAKRQNLEAAEQINAKFSQLLEDLEEHFNSGAASDNLREILIQAQEKGIAAEYTAMARFLAALREQEIARLGSAS